jgi:hypothetical protein
MYSKRHLVGIKIININYIGTYITLYSTYTLYYLTPHMGLILVGVSEEGQKGT